jgi:hypothetical protein
LNFEDYIASRDIRNYGKRLYKIPAIDYMHVLSEPPENMEEIRESFKPEEQSLYQFNELHKLKTHYFINSDDNDGMALTEYRIISMMPFEKSKLKKGVVALSQMGKHRQIIYPFFYHISFRKTFNIFVCSMEVHPFPNPRYDIYYFDTNGRLINQEKNLKTHRRALPPVGFINYPTQIVAIKPLPEKFTLSKVIDLYTYLIAAHGEARLYGIIDNEGKWIIKPNYSELIYQKGKKFAFVKKDYQYYGLEISTGKLSTFPFDFEQFFKIETYNSESLRVSVRIGEKSKYGIIDYNNNVLCPIEQGFVEFSNSTNRTIVYNRYPGYPDRVKIELSDFMKIERYDFAYKALNVKIGVVDQLNNEVIPIEQDYIKEISIGHYIVNKGCDIISATYHDDELQDERIVRGGQWYLYDEDGNEKKKITHEKAKELVSGFHWFQDQPILIIE